MKKLRDIDIPFTAEDFAEGDVLSPKEHEKCGHPRAVEVTDIETFAKFTFAVMQEA